MKILLANLLLCLALKSSTTCSVVRVSICSGVYPLNEYFWSPFYFFWTVAIYSKILIFYINILSFFQLFTSLCYLFFTFLDLWFLIEENRTNRFQKNIFIASDKIIKPQHSFSFDWKFFSIFIVVVSNLFLVIVFNFFSTVNVNFFLFLSLVKVDLNWLVEFFVHFVFLKVDLFGQVFHNKVEFREVGVYKQSFFIDFKKIFLLSGTC